MEEIQIEKNIPIPTITRRSAQRDQWRAIAELMEVGDSFLVSLTDDKLATVRAQISLTLIRGFSEFKFTTRKVEGGLRVWRTE